MLCPKPSGSAKSPFACCPGWSAAATAAAAKPARPPPTSSEPSFCCFCLHSGCICTRVATRREKMGSVLFDKAAWLVKSYLVQERLFDKLGSNRLAVEFPAVQLDTGGKQPRGSGLGLKRPHATKNSRGVPGFLGLKIRCPAFTREARRESKECKRAWTRAKHSTGGREDDVKLHLHAAAPSSVSNATKTRPMCWSAAVGGRLGSLARGMKQQTTFPNFSHSSFVSSMMSMYVSSSCRSERVTWFRVWGLGFSPRFDLALEGLGRTWFRVWGLGFGV